jgi:hypothetical protein
MARRHCRKDGRAQVALFQGTADTPVEETIVEIVCGTGTADWLAGFLPINFTQGESVC